VLHITVQRTPQISRAHNKKVYRIKKPKETRFHLCKF
jgi:hypothetical protein